MNKREFMEYIEDNLDISKEAKKLIKNILYYVELQMVDRDDQQLMLGCMLNGIGLDYDDIEKISL